MRANRGTAAFVIITLLLQIHVLLHYVIDRLSTNSDLFYFCLNKGTVVVTMNQPTINHQF